MKKLITALLLLSITIVSFAKENNDSIYRRLPHTVVAAGGAVVINAAVTEGFKHGVHELRPDRTRIIRFRRGILLGFHSFDSVVKRTISLQPMVESWCTGLVICSRYPEGGVAPSLGL